MRTVTSKQVSKLKAGTAFVMLAFVLSAVSYAGIVADPSSTALSARPIGMGSAFTAFKGESAGIFLNPAGIETIRDWQVSITSIKLLTEIDQNIITGAYKSPWGTFGIGFVDINSGGSYGTMRDSSNMGRIIANPTAEAMGQDSNVLALSYAKKFYYMGDLTFGVNLKTFNQTIAGSSDSASRGTAMDLDLGVNYSPDTLPWLTAGLCLQNAFGQSLKWSGASSAQDQISSMLKLGASGRLLGKNAYFDRYTDHDLIAAFDIDLPRSSLSGSGMRLHGGVEWKPVKMLSLRAGLDQSPSGINLNYGIGLERSAFRFDYAFKGDPVTEGTSHIFTLSYAPEPEAPKPAVKKGPYVFELSSPSDMSSTSDEVILLKGKVLNADIIKALRVNGKPLMPFVTGNSFEAYWYPLLHGPNTLSIEADIVSPEAETVGLSRRLLRAAGIKDVKPQYFAKDPIEYLNKLDLMKGYSDGSFKPDKPITRAELVTLLVKARGATIEALPKVARFKDMKKPFWASRFIYTGVKLGLVSGYSDKTFKPNKFVTRAESAVILTKFDSLAPSKPASNVYTDVSVKHWASDYIDTAKNAGMLSFIAVPSFEAKRSSTRGEIAFMMSRTGTVGKLIDKYFGPVPTKEASAVIAAGLDVLPPPDRHHTIFNSIIVAGSVASKDIYGVTVDPVKVEINNGVFGQMFELKKGENMLNVKALDRSGKELSSFKRLIIKN